MLHIGYWISAVLCLYAFLYGALLLLLSLAFVSPFTNLIWSALVASLLILTVVPFVASECLSRLLEGVEIKGRYGKHEIFAAYGSLISFGVGGLVNIFLRNWDIPVNSRMFFLSIPTILSGLLATILLTARYQRYHNVSS